MTSFTKPPGGGNTPIFVAANTNAIIYASSGATGTGGTIELRNNAIDNYAAVQYNVTQDLVDTSAEFWRMKVNYTTPQTGWATAQIARPVYLRVDHLATDTATPTQNVSNGVYSLLVIGETGGVAAKGTSHAFTAGVAVRNSADAGNERSAYFGYIRNESPATPGRDWLFDLGVHGAIGVQQSYLSGFNLVANNYFNGSPSAAESDAVVISGKPATGAGVPAGTAHHDADTFPFDNAIHILGTSGTNASPTNAAFKRGVKIGGTGSGWNLTASRVQTGVEIQDFDTYGLRIPDRHSAGDTANSPAISVANGAGGLCVGVDTLTNPATTLMEVVTTGSADPVAFFRSSSATGAVSVRIQNGAGVASYFASGGVGGFLSGTAAGDTGVKLNSVGKQFHIGGAVKVLTVSQDDKLAFFAKTPVAQQTGGALTAAGTYGANEQTMLQRVYDAVRNVGIMA